MFRNMMKASALSLLVAGLLALMLLTTFSGARAQTPSIINPPYNQDSGAIITNALRGAGTVTSAQQSNLNWRGVLCKLVQTVSSGSPSTTFKIQGYDAATASYSDLATSGAVTGYPGDAETTTGQSIMIYPASTLTTTPTGWVLNAIHLPRVWRLSQTIAAGSGGSGKSPSTTSKIGCNYLN